MKIVTINFNDYIIVIYYDLLPFDEKNTVLPESINWKFTGMNKKDSKENNIPVAE